jgi:hypothetical protein
MEASNQQSETGGGRGRWWLRIDEEEEWELKMRGIKNDWRKRSRRRIGIGIGMNRLHQRILETFLKSKIN